MMDPSEYGPFADTVGIAGALVATFSVLLLKMLGSIKQWTWLAGESPSFVVTAGARVLAIALMAAAYVTIQKSNYIWFIVAAVGFGLVGFVMIARFDRQRRRHVLSIPLVGEHGTQLVDSKGRPRYGKVVIGSESDMNAQAKSDLTAAREKSGGLSLVQFMSGYGSNQVNDPAPLWDRNYLADISNRLTVMLMLVVLLAVMTLFLAASVVDVTGHAP